LGAWHAPGFHAINRRAAVSRRRRAGFVPAIFILRFRAQTRVNRWPGQRLVGRALRARVRCKLPRPPCDLWPSVQHCSSVRELGCHG